MKHVKNLTFIVTGGSKGVGLSICRMLLSNGAQIINLSRTPSLINSDSMTNIQCDLNSPQSVNKAIENIKKTTPNIDCIVFNAASARYGYATQTDDKDIQNMIQVNYLSPQKILMGILSIASSDFETIYVSSSATMLPAPCFAHYTSTKLAFESFLLSFSMEENFTVHIVRPAEIETDFGKNSGVPLSSDAGVKKLSPDKVAADTLKLFRSKKIFINSGLRAKIIHAIMRLKPGILLKRKVTLPEKINN